MSKATAVLREDLAEGPPPPARGDVQGQLGAILASPFFHGSRRCRQFLEYVCAKALEGDAGAIKERAVAVEVFGRHPA